MDSACYSLLQDLCFLDERDADAKIAWSELLDRYGQLGVCGPVQTMFKLERCQAEVASVYAEVFSRLGYLTVAREFSPSEFGELTAALRATFEDEDFRRSEAEQLLGPPSLVVDQRVLCYACADPAAGWLYVDCQAEDVRTYRPGEGTYAMARDDDPLIRSLRRSAGEFEAGLILTLYGKVKRWGTGWWIDHPSADSTEESLAIAQQLKMIREADPSQAGRQQQPECEDVGPCGRWASHGAK